MKMRFDYMQRFLSGIIAAKPKKSNYYNLHSFADRVNWTNSRWLSFYLDISSLKGRRVHVTGRNISFTENPDFIKNPRRYINNHYGGISMFDTVSFKDHSIEINYFKLRFSGFKIHAECHFLRNWLFLYRYNFVEIDNESFEKGVIRKLEMKYGIDGVFNVKNDCIVNDHLTMVNCSDTYSINYVNYYGTEFYNYLMGLKLKEWEVERAVFKRNKNELISKLQGVTDL